MAPNIVMGTHFDDFLVLLIVNSGMDEDNRPLVICLILRFLGKARPVALILLNIIFNVSDVVQIYVQ